MNLCKPLPVRPRFRLLSTPFLDDGDWRLKEVAQEFERVLPDALAERDLYALTAIWLLVAAKVPYFWLL